jgi:hypothetical protein
MGRRDSIPVCLVVWPFSCIPLPQEAYMFHLVGFDTELTLWCGDVVWCGVV